MHLAIRANGGPNIGYGHLVRTGALAKYALDEGDKVTYATRTPEPARQVCPERISVVSLDPAREHEAFLNWLSKDQPDVVLTDSYEIDTDRQRAIGELTPKLAVLQDDTRFTVCSDVVINGNIYASRLDYDWVGDEPKWCLGTDYLLLREKIRDLAARAPPSLEVAENALVTMGGSDTQNMTPKVVRAFDGIELKVDIIVGPGFDNRMEIEQALAETDGNFEIAEDPENLPERMFQADLAVSATGSTIYELVLLGTPTIGVPQVENQKPIADVLAEREAIVRLNPERIEDLPAKIACLADLTDERTSLQKRGIEVLDYRGVERIYDKIAETPSL